jgi:hypothetical protein
MLTEIERPSQFRVLMRIPRLRHHLPTSGPAEPVSKPTAEHAPPVLEYEVTEVTQQVVEDTAEHRGHRWLRPMTLAQVAVVILAVVIAMLLRGGGTPATDESPDMPLEIPMVTMPAMSGALPGGAPVAQAEPTAGTVAFDGGSPTEITSAPELTLPATTVTDVDPLTMIERLPPVTMEGSAAPPDTANASAAAPTADQAAPGVARLEKRIETPKPDAHYDSSRPGLY